MFIYEEEQVSVTSAKEVISVRSTVRTSLKSHDVFALMNLSCCLSPCKGGVIILHFSHSVPPLSLSLSLPSIASCMCDRSTRIISLTERGRATEGVCAEGDGNVITDKSSEAMRQYEHS